MNMTIPDTDATEIQSSLQALLNDCRQAAHSTWMGDPIEWGSDGFEAMADNVAAIARLLNITLVEPDFNAEDDEEVITNPCHWCGQPSMPDDTLCLRCWGGKSAGLSREETLEMDDDEEDDEEVVTNVCHWCGQPSMPNDVFCDRCLNGFRAGLSREEILNMPVGEEEDE